MVLLALVSIAFIVYDEVARPVGSTRTAILVIDGVIVVIFVVEFLERLWRSPDRRAFMRRNWIEIPGMVPMIVGEASFLRVFRLARLVQIVRLLRIVTLVARLRRANRIASIFVARSHVLTTAVVASMVIVGAAFAAFLFERSHPETQIHTFWDALWWAVVTASTVGYGDIVPRTVGGRVVAGFLMFTGVGLIGVLAATIASGMTRVRESAEAPPMEARPVEERLAELARLRSEGSLSDEEFRDAKRQVLEQG